MSKQDDEMMRQYAFREKPSIMKQILDKAGPLVRLSDLVRTLLRMYAEDEISKERVEEWLKNQDD